MKSSSIKEYKKRVYDDMYEPEQDSIPDDPAIPGIHSYVVPLVNPAIELINYASITNVKLGSVEILFSNTIALDGLKKTTYFFDGNGRLVDVRHMKESQFQAYKTYMDEIEGLNSIVDIFGNDILIHESHDYVDIKTEEKKNFGSKIMSNSAMIFLAFNNPTIFWKNIEEKIIAESESTMQKLIRFAVTGISHFDETFAVEVCKPESPLMRLYLSKLAELVNVELSKSEENDLENIAELRMQAWTFAGYKGKDLETVTKEEVDYAAHFRYLLTKGDKIIITEEQKEYYDKIKEYTKLLGFRMKESRETDIEDILPFSEFFYYKEFIPQVTTSKDSINVRYYTYVENMLDVEKYLTSSGMDLKIALVDELLTKKYSTPGSKLANIKSNIFICDKNFNYGLFSIKASTVNKWKKNLKDSLVLLENILQKGRTTVPYEFNNLTL